MIKKKLQINCLKTLMILLIVSFFASSIVYAEQQLTADALLAQCRDKYAQANDLWKSKKHDEAKSLYQYVAQNSSDSDLAMKSRIWVAGCDIHLGNVSGAEQAIEAVKNEFSTQDGLCAELYIFSDEYVLKGKFDEAKTLLQFIAQNSSDSDLVMKCRVWAAGCDIYLGNYSAAEQAIEAVKNDFSTQDGLCAELDSLSDQYWVKGKFDKAKTLLQFIAENSSDSDLAIEAQMWVLGCEILLADDSTADQVFEKLTNDYSQHPDLPKVAMKIRSYVVKSKIRSGNDTAVEQAVERLKNDYSQHPQLCASIFQIGEEYYFRAEEAMRNDNSEQARADFQKAIAIWQKNINQTTNSHHRSMACYFTAIAYQYLKDYQKSTAYYQKVFSEFPDSKYAAHALFMTGRNYEKNRKAATATVVLENVTDPNSATASVETSINPVNSTRAAYELLVEEYPDSPSARYARKWLSKRNSR